METITFTLGAAATGIAGPAITEQILVAAATAKVLAVALESVEAKGAVITRCSTLIA